MIKFRSLPQFDKPASIVLIDKEQLGKKEFTHLRNNSLKQTLLNLNKKGQFSAGQGEIFPFFIGDTLVLLVGLGKRDEVSPTAIRIVVRAALLSAFLKKIKEIEIVPHQQQDPVVRSVIEGFLIGTYAWKKYLNDPEEEAKGQFCDQKTLHLVAPEKRLYQEIIAACQGVTLARDLINDNADTITAEYFEKMIREMVRGKKNISLEILGKKEMQAKGLNLHLAVNQASRKEPRLIIVKYDGASTKGNYTAIIGKGVTFDTGGLNIKPTGSMETMRSDMSGAAAVAGTLKNVLQLQVKKNIIFVCALAENAIGSGAYKPGDVFRSYNGKTVEILNTDAEGRLVLADAISYVARNYKPVRLIDLATLTGACVIALGYDYSGLVCNDDAFSRSLIHASNETDDRAWRLPTYVEIKEYIKSNIADIKNVGLPKGAAGVLTAAEFLRQFTENLPWAHFDIAGTAFVDGKGRMYFGHGATGSGVRLLTEYLKNN